MGELCSVIDNSFVKVLGYENLREGEPSSHIKRNGVSNNIPSWKTTFKKKRLNNIKMRLKGP